MNKIILFSIIFCGISIVQGNFTANTNNSNDNKNTLNQNANETPDKIVQSLFDNYFVPIKEKNPAENESLFVDAIKTIIKKYFDIEKIVNTVLGPNKTNFSEHEKNEFTELLINQMSRVYGKQFSEFEDIKNFEITTVTNTERKKDKKKCCTVTSSVLMKGEKIELKWFFLENDNHEMKIIDIKVAGISLTQNWKDQVKSLLLKHKKISDFLNNFNN